MISITRKLIFPVLDVFFTNCAFVGALLLRFEGSIPAVYMQAYNRYGFYLSILAVLVFAGFRLYSNLWQYASIYDLETIFLAVTAFSILNFLFYLVVPESLPRSVFILIWGLMLFFTFGSRLARRLLSSWRLGLFRSSGKGNNLLIIGGGQAGSMIIKELFEHRELGQPVAIIDEDIEKKGNRIHGVPVAGTMADLNAAVAKYNVREIIVAIPSAREEDIARILNQCKETGCKLKRLSGLYQSLNGETPIKQIRDVSISDLLGRPEVELDMDSICTYLKDRVVLVTGAGGSIGSELCRQITKFAPKLLVLLDNYENCLYELQLELSYLYPRQNLKALVGSVQDEKRVDQIMAQNKPQVVFHAAAHKHVPLMEDSPSEAIKNNIFGTINVAEAASRHGVQKFVLISTDKAVNPANIMGASKRVAEIAIQQINKRSATEYSTVRFGNVLGSNASVLPIFQKQIARGGPVTVTHPDITRYFMTIPEAVQLVLQAAAFAEGGEVFILDMGEPVKIVDLARDLIKLSGFREEEIAIEITGLRPGEKMFEELLLDVETADRTKHSKIFVCRAKDEQKALKEELRFLERVLRVKKNENISLSHLLAQSEVAATKESQ